MQRCTPKTCASTRAARASVSAASRCTCLCQGCSTSRMHSPRWRLASKSVCRSATAHRRCRTRHAYRGASSRSTKARTSPCWSITRTPPTRSRTSWAPRPDMDLSADRIAEAAEGRLVIGDPATPGPRRAVVDSREVHEGDLFVGLRGEHVDGGDYARQALDKGAWGVMVAGDYGDRL